MPDENELGVWSYKKQEKKKHPPQTGQCLRPPRHSRKRHGAPGSLRADRELEKGAVPATSVGVTHCRAQSHLLPGRPPRAGTGGAAHSRSRRSRRPGSGPRGAEAAALPTPAHSQRQKTAATAESYRPGAQASRARRRLGSAPMESNRPRRATSGSL